MDGEGGYRRAGADAATEEDSADAHYGVVHAEDRSWPRRWTTSPFDQTWHRWTPPGQRDATINPWDVWTNHDNLIETNKIIQLRANDEVR